MKGMDLFCSSLASTAVTPSMDKENGRMVRRSTKRYAKVGRRSQPRVPCSSSQLPINPKARPYYEKHRKSSADHKQNRNSGSDVRKKTSVKVNNDLYSHHPNGSSSRRYLLSDAPFISWVSESESDKIPAMTPAQVVVLRVSLHCKACEGKVRKHISKMEGVTSFSIDMETKKVTIIGQVTQLGVLASVSKVKNALLWSSPLSSSSSFL